MLFAGQDSSTVHLTEEKAKKGYKMPGSGGAMEEDLLDPEWLFRELRTQNGPNKLLILDCRAHSDFSDAHIRGSVPLAIPSIMLRRLAAGKVDLLSTIRCLDLRNRVEVFLCGDESSRGTFILIGDSTDPAGHQGETIQVLSRRLKSSGGNVAILIGENASLYDSTFLLTAV